LKSENDIHFETIINSRLIVKLVVGSLGRF